MPKVDANYQPKIAAYIPPEQGDRVRAPNFEDSGGNILAQQAIKTGSDLANEDVNTGQAVGRMINTVGSAADSAVNSVASAVYAVKYAQKVKQRAADAAQTIANSSEANAAANDAKQQMQNYTAGRFTDPLNANYSPDAQQAFMDDHKTIIADRRTALVQKMGTTAGSDKALEAYDKETNNEATTMNGKFDTYRNTTMEFKAKANYQQSVDNMTNAVADGNLQGLVAQQQIFKSPSTAMLSAAAGVTPDQHKAAYQGMIAKSITGAMTKLADPDPWITDAKGSVLQGSADRLQAIKQFRLQLEKNVRAGGAYDGADPKTIEMAITGADRFQTAAEEAHKQAVNESYMHMGLQASHLSVGLQSGDPNVRMQARNQLITLQGQIDNSIDKLPENERAMAYSVSKQIDSYQVSGGKTGIARDSNELERQKGNMEIQFHNQQEEDKYNAKSNDATQLQNGINNHLNTFENKIKVAQAANPKSLKREGYIVGTGIDAADIRNASLANEAGYQKGIILQHQYEQNNKAIDLYAKTALPVNVNDPVAAEDWRDLLRLSATGVSNDYLGLISKKIKPGDANAARVNKAIATLMQGIKRDNPQVSSYQARYMAEVRYLQQAIYVKHSVYNPPKPPKLPFMKTADELAKGEFRSTPELRAEQLKMAGFKGLAPVMVKQKDGTYKEVH